MDFLALAVALIAAPEPDPVAASAARLRAEARVREQPAQAAACLAAWAAARRGEAPADARPEEISALDDHEDLRLYATAAGERLRLGWVDPAGVVGRVEAALVGPEGRRQLLPALDARTRRLPRDARGVIEVVARARDCIPGAVLAVLRIPLEPAPVRPPPSAPVLSAPKPGPERLEPAEMTREPAFAWWWYAALGVVAAGAGLAVWEETR